MHPASLQTADVHACEAIGSMYELVETGSDVCTLIQGSLRIVNGWHGGGDEKRRLWAF